MGRLFYKRQNAYFPAALPVLLRPFPLEEYRARRPPDQYNAEGSTANSEPKGTRNKKEGEGYGGEIGDREGVPATKSVVFVATDDG